MALKHIRNTTFRTWFGIIGGNDNQWKSLKQYRLLAEHTYFVVFNAYIILIDKFKNNLQH